MIEGDADSAGAPGRDGLGPLWLAVVGKGGSGKSVIAGTLARLLARRGHPVLALDSDPMPGLSISLGVEEPAEPPLVGAAEQDEEGRWRLRKGIGPVRAIRDFSTPAPDGVRLLQLGKTVGAGQLVLPSVNAWYRVVHRLRESKTLRAWAVVGDLPAGPRQAGARFAPYARTFVVLCEPTWQSALAARRLARIARLHPGAEVALVASKVTGPADHRRVARMTGETVAAAIPVDGAVTAAERRGVAVLDAAPRSNAVQAIERLVDELEARRL
jgi:CO dehydrogenase maturation factor